MTPLLLIFTIGPVQSFISQARKTKDLFAGSSLLSSLTRQAYGRLKQKVGGQNIELVFPAFFDQSGNEVSSNPNRFAVKISNVDAAALRTACEAVKMELMQIDFVDAAIQQINLLPGAIKVETDARQQLANHLEIFWAALPIDGNYATVYSKLESALGGIKNIRPFDQLKEQGRKCNVDGIRNALYVRHVQNENGAERGKPSFVQSNYYKLNANDSRVEQGEGLSAISMYKRLYGTSGFPSTVKIALLQMLDEIKKDKSKSDLYGDYKKLLPGDWDEQLLFEENLTPKYFRKHEHSAEVVNDQIRPDITVKYKELVKAVGTFKPSYYATLVFDGDRMGEWMSGAHIENPADLLTFQSTLKDLLRDFAIWANGYLDEPKGKTIYAGGDDFLGFVNLHHLFDVLKEMRMQFESMVNKPLRNERQKFKVKPNSQFSFSAGVAIAHYKEPLTLVLQEAREAEKKAKKHGLDCFSISIIRHSGGATRCVFPFGDVGTGALNAMDEITLQLSKGHFSNQFISALIAETRLWEGASPRGLFDVEAARLVKRARIDKEIDFDKMINPVEVLSGKNINGSTLSKDPLKNITDALRICDFIHRAIKNDADDNA